METSFTTNWHGIDLVRLHKKTNTLHYIGFVFDTKKIEHELLERYKLIDKEPNKDKFEKFIANNTILILEDCIKLNNFLYD